MTPELQIESVRQVFNDGNHNAFTDIVQFKDKLYLTFRSCPEGHMLFTSSRIVVLESDDGDAWTEVCTFSVPLRDVRDPHLLVFDGKLFVYSGTWWVDPAGGDRDINHHVGYAAWSEDGRAWHGPRLLNGTHGHYIWRTAAHDGRAFLNGRRVRDFAVITSRPQREEPMESWLLGSDNGFDWTPVGLMQPAYGDETALLVEEDGSILALARTMGDQRNAQLCRAEPPYTEWSRTDLDRYVGGPMLERWGDHYLVGGRKKMGDNPPVTTLYWLIDDQLHEIAELPSGGDNSYPGFVALSPTHGLLSFYSSHEGSGSGLAPSAIYLASLRLT